MAMMRTSKYFIGERRTAIKITLVDVNLAQININCSNSPEIEFCSHVLCFEGLRKEADVFKIA